MKSWVINILFATVFIFIGWFANVAWNLPRDLNPIAEIKPRPFEKYTIENLSKAEILPSKIETGEIIKEDPKFSSYEYFMTFDPSSTGGNQKKVSGMLNIPKGPGPFPLIVMLRGFVEPETYFTGQGTVRGAEYFARNGFITIAPDFLGYGKSDLQPSDVFESRFQTYTTVLTLLKSLEAIKSGELSNESINYSSLGLWGHSNGGQIALTVLEITQKTYPTVLWAPVSKPFPYSIMYYTDSPVDYGKSLRQKLAKFEEDYDVDLYSIHKYYDRIKSPIKLNQGMVDPSVPSAWSDELSKTLEDSGVDIEYSLFHGNDHNMQPNWASVIQSDLIFFKNHLAN
ncbi:MAG TPA: alpha/beta fold hydrolase [Patescibacteria group bacterium]|nr:alpha/beta fold hydrolase [Patescibacteria group bacterium]